MGTKMTTGETRGLIAVAIVMAACLILVAWNRGRFASTEPAGAVATGAIVDSLPADSVAKVTVNEPKGRRRKKGKAKPSSPKVYKTRSPLDEPVAGEN